MVSGTPPVRRHFAVAAGLVLAAGAVLHFSYLTWGTPSWEKTFRIFPNREALEAHIGRILELREKYWNAFSEMVDPKRSDQVSREIYRKTFLIDEQVPPWAELPEDFVLERVRGTLIGVALSDEQHT